MSNLFMPNRTTEASSSLKRKRASTPEQPVPEKRHKYHHASFFWDTLSRIWLTEPAIKELRRRTECSHRQGEACDFKQSTHKAADRTLSATDILEQTNPSDLKRFARCGGPDMTDIRNFKEPTMSNAPEPSRDSSECTQSKRTAAASRRSSKTSKSRRTSAYEPNFEQHLVDHGIHMTGRRKPSKWKDLRDVIALPRSSLPSSQVSESEFERFCQKLNDATSEAMVTKNILPIILGDSDIPSGENLRFTNLEPLTDGSLVDAQPDLFDGCRPEQVHPTIRRALSNLISPSDKSAVLILPNFFIEAKGPEGTITVAKRQACYDGALGARAMYKIRSHDKGARNDDYAYTISATYGQGSLKIFTHHAAVPTESPTRPEYHMTQLRGWDITDSVEIFCEAVACLRNARDWAKQQRDIALSCIDVDALKDCLASSALEEVVEPKEEDACLHEEVSRSKALVASSGRRAVGLSKPKSTRRKRRAI